MDTPGSGKSVAAFSVDVEDYYQVEVLREFCPRDQWTSFDDRIVSNTSRLLDLATRFSVRGTFFILGWNAQRHPDLVRRIASEEHEIASHGMGHRMLRHLTPDEFHKDLLDSRSLLEDTTGQRVVGYRAPTFSVTRETAWALDVLADAGYQYDSSVFPIRHDRYGVPEAPTGIHRATGPGGGTVLEIPPLTLRLLGTNIPAGGGGYLRLLPVRTVGWAHFGRSVRSAQRSVVG